MQTKNVKPRLEHGSAPIREDGSHRIEVHVAGVCVRQVKGQWEVLIARRSGTRSLYPGKWECGGGQVKKGENFQDALKRQFFEEFGIDVEPQDVLETYAIPIPDGQRVIPGLRFLCTATADARVQINQREFSSFRWVTFPVPKLHWIEGVKKILDGLAPQLQNEDQKTLRKPMIAERNGLSLVRINPDSVG